MRKLARSMAVALALAAGSPALAGVIVAPVSAVVNAGGSATPISNTYDRSGLFAPYVPGVTDFDAYMATNPQHTAAFNTEWFSGSGVSAATITYDLGSALTLDRLALWNEEASGIGRFSLGASTDGISFTSVGGPFTPFNNPSGPPLSYGPQQFGFAAVTARYVRFDIAGCPQPDDLPPYPGCAIGEVAFRVADAQAPVPEPAAWAMMIAGFGLVGGALRTRRGALAPAA